MMPCAIHNVMMGGRGPSTGATHLFCPKCEKEGEENGRLIRAIEFAIKDLNVDCTMSAKQRLHEALGGK